MGFIREALFLLICITLCIAQAPNILVGGVAQQNTMVSSNDGLTFTTNVATPFASVTGVAWSPPLKIYVATGTRGTSTIASSTDGTTWTDIPTLFPDGGTGVVWDTFMFIAYGRGGNFRIASSTDGRIFVPATIHLSEVNDACFAGNQNRWLAVGRGTPAQDSNVAVSTDGAATFRPAGVALFESATACAFNAATQRWVVTGRGINSVAWSTDGTVWQGDGGTIYPVATGATAASQFNRIYFIGGQGLNPLKSSFDGFTFTNVAGSINNNNAGNTVRAITYSSQLRRYFAVGSSNDIGGYVASSTDGKTFDLVPGTFFQGAANDGVANTITSNELFDCPLVCCEISPRPIRPGFSSVILAMDFPFATFDCVSFTATLASYVGVTVPNVQVLTVRREPVIFEFAANVNATRKFVSRVQEGNFKQIPIQYMVVNGNTLLPPQAAFPWYMIGVAISAGIVVIVLVLIAIAYSVHLNESLQKGKYRSV